jgi:hypothetical protein
MELYKLVYDGFNENHEVQKNSGKQKIVIKNADNN